jgi:hypothetical protein
MDAVTDSPHGLLGEFWRNALAENAYFQRYLVFWPPHVCLSLLTIPSGQNLTLFPSPLDSKHFNRSVLVTPLNHILHT